MIARERFACSARPITINAKRIRTNHESMLKPRHMKSRGSSGWLAPLDQPDVESARLAIKERGIGRLGYGGNHIEAESGKVGRQPDGD